jgi:hypothetical protein
MHGRHVTFAKELDIAQNSSQIQYDSDSEQKYSDKPKTLILQKVSERPGTTYPIGKQKLPTESQLSNKEKLDTAAAAYIHKRLAFLSDPAAQRRHAEKQEAKEINAQKREAHRRKHLRPGY